MATDNCAAAGLVLLRSLGCLTHVVDNAGTAWLIRNARGGCLTEMQPDHSAMM